ncbi:organic cation transporter protein [Halyomorpha halys]|uniref:organic cation transporter protein n=1 Tax=Halyomorpha halys TaxID=286706 RepID=UPI0006D5052A|nr:organic cation transporter protein-like isoform X1 [Halyomorpha halys]
MDPVVLEKALETKCKNYTWLVRILFLTTTPIIFNSVHLTSYTFLGGNPSFFCNVPELVEANWTKEQIREISSPGLEKQSCVQYAWNYSLLKEMGFKEALDYFNRSPKPDVIKCKNYIYNEEVFHQTVVSEWDLVCDNAPLSSTVQGAVAIGKFFGAITFGLFSDRFGRKKIFVFSCLLYAIAGNVAAFVKSYAMFIMFRVLIGLAGAGVLDACYTIILELTVKSYRACLGNMFNLGFSLGMVYLPVAAYLTSNWRQLELAISVPMFLFIIHCWFMPESPRWLITTGNFDKAAKILGKEHELDFKEIARCPPEEPQSVLDQVCIFWKRYLELFSSLELTKRLLICSFTWFLGNLYYFSIALNGSNIDVNEYLYVGLNGIVEIPGYLSPIIFLKYFGRRSTGIFLWFVAGVILLATTVTPKGWPMMCISLFGRLVGTGAYGVVMLYASELFPTEHRNFAIGSCTTVAQLGPLLAPYLVDTLGKIAGWMPTAVCGLLALLGAFFLVLLPETRDTPMPDTIKEMNLR